MLPGRIGSTRIKIIDESYNANPISMLATIECFFSAPASGRKVWVLGDMLELGDRSKALHLDLASAIASCEPALVFLQGKNMGYLVRPLIEQHKVAPAICPHRATRRNRARAYRPISRRD